VFGVSGFDVYGLSANFNLFVYQIACWNCSLINISYYLLAANLNYKVLLISEPEGGFTVKVPALEGCITYGEDLEQAKTNAREAIELYIESLRADGLPIPKTVIRSS
jgi:antitoxin HicB